MMSVGGYHEYTGGVQYTGGISSVHWRVFSSPGVIMSTPGGYKDACGRLS